MPTEGTRHGSDECGKPLVQAGTDGFCTLPAGHEPPCVEHVKPVPSEGLGEERERSQHYSSSAVGRAVDELLAENERLRGLLRNLYNACPDWMRSGPDVPRAATEAHDAFSHPTEETEPIADVSAAPLPNSALYRAAQRRRRASAAEETEGEARCQRCGGVKVIGRHFPHQERCPRCKGTGVEPASSDLPGEQGGARG